MARHWTRPRSPRIFRREFMRMQPGELRDRVMRLMPSPRPRSKAVRPKGLPPLPPVPTGMDFECEPALGDQAARKLEEIASEQIFAPYRQRPRQPEYLDPRGINDVVDSVGFAAHVAHHRRGNVCDNPAERLGVINGNYEGLRMFRDLVPNPDVQALVGGGYIARPKPPAAPERGDVLTLAIIQEAVDWLKNAEAQQIEGPDSQHYIVSPEMYRALDIVSKRHGMTMSQVWQLLALWAADDKLKANRNDIIEELITEWQKNTK